MGFHLHGKTNPHVPIYPERGPGIRSLWKNRCSALVLPREELPELQCPKESIAGPVETSPLERGSGCFIDSPVSLDCQMVPVIAHPVAQLCLTSTEGALLKVL